MKSVIPFNNEGVAALGSVRVERIGSNWVFTDAIVIAKARSFKKLIEAVALKGIKLAMVGCDCSGYVIEIG